MKVLNTLDEAINYVNNSFQNKSEILLLADELLDPVGINMAIITDVVVKNGYMPDLEGFEQKEGYRIYTYVKD